MVSLRTARHPILRTDRLHSTSVYCQFLRRSFSKSTLLLETCLWYLIAVQGYVGYSRIGGFVHPLFPNPTILQIRPYPTFLPSTRLRGFLRVGDWTWCNYGPTFWTWVISLLVRSPSPNKDLLPSKILLNFYAYHVQSLLDSNGLYSRVTTGSVQVPILACAFPPLHRSLAVLKSTGDFP